MPSQRVLHCTLRIRNSTTGQLPSRAPQAVRPSPRGLRTYGHGVLKREVWVGSGWAGNSGVSGPCAGLEGDTQRRPIRTLFCPHWHPAGGWNPPPPPFCCNQGEVFTLLSVAFLIFQLSRRALVLFCSFGSPCAAVLARPSADLHSCLPIL